MSRLFVDVGNTALKWRWREGERCQQGGCRHERQWSAVMATLPVADQVWVASVAGSEADQAIAACLKELTGVAPQFYYSRAQHLGVRSCYPEPRRLGADRWVAMVECYQRFGASVVIDCGSALTIDAVDADGRFLGGYIVPGLGMLRNALLRDTADVHVEPGGASLALGQSTGQCVHNGLLRMSVAFVTDVVVELRQTLADTCQVVVTGGDAAELSKSFSFDFLHMPDLVLDGLERVAAQQQ
ncbi:transcriptional activator [Alcanivorax hongdengensis A-11-3]|uniref:Type III pantothenate kinase n=1 Tax=Alcanivorax hongdengensis A-11-3 TaxID=1177179 RepID=L0W781_9GAMM|nr:type III pantothenate kinase [Alcanivorax hongdengensis]EKF72789.1 transcriptional activator [Alcanivorax hongdengensis A-11-3]